MYPIYKKMCNKINGRIAILICIIFLLGVYALIIWKLVPLVKNNFSHIWSLVETYASKLSKVPFLEDLNSSTKIKFDTLISSCGSIVSIVVNIVLSHIFGFYMLYNYDTIKSYVKSIIPKKKLKLITDYTNKLSLNMRVYLRGTLIDTGILFVISFLLYLLIGLDYPFILALFSALTNIIPFIGPYIGGIPAVLVGLSGSLNLGIITLAVIIFAQTVESNFINPMIMSKCIKINPLLIVITLSIMGKFLGVIGMVFAVPILIVIKLTIEFIKKYKNNINLKNPIKT